MKALVGAFNQEKALVGAFSVIVETDCGTDGSFYSTTHVILPAQLAASVMERKTCLETRGREVTRKRLLIQRLRMAVVTMHDYVRRDAVVLPGDKRWTPSSL